MAQASARLVLDRGPSRADRPSWDASHRDRGLDAERAGLVLPFPAGSYARPDESRLQALGSRLDEVTRRLERLQSQAVAHAPDAARRSDGAIQRIVSASLRDARFDVTHQSLAAAVRGISVTAR